MPSTTVQSLTNVGNLQDGDVFVGERVTGTTVRITFNGVAITKTGTITSGTWQATPIGLPYGGSGTSLTASNGGIVYTNATTMAVLAGTPTASQMLLSGASATPTWSASTIPSNAGATAGKVLLSDGINYVLSTPTFPNASATAGKRIKSDGTNWVASTTTLPDTGTSGKVLIGNGTNYVESTPTFPNASATSGKVIVSDGTNWIASTPTFPNASATAGTRIKSDGTNWIASTTTMPDTGTSGKVLIGNGTNYVESTPSFPNASATSGKRIASDGTNWVASSTTMPDTGTTGKLIRGNGTNYVETTSTFADTYTASNLLYSNGANTVTGLPTANSGVLVTSGSGVPSIANDIPTAVTIGGAYVYRVGGTTVAVTDGGTGKASNTAYAVLCGGTTSTGNLQSIASVGSSGQVLTSNGAGALPTFQGLTSTACVLIASATASSSATVDFTGLNSTYIAYKVIFDNIVPSVNSTDLWMRLGTGGGPTWGSGGTDYIYSIGLSVQNATSSAIGSTGAAQTVFMTTLGTGTGQNTNGEVIIYNPSQATKYHQMSWTGSVMSATPDQISFYGGGRYINTTAVTGIRFLMSSGNIVSGDFRLYGFTA